MKYITFAIMAALILGVAASPALQNGFAFAEDQVEAPESAEKPEYTEKELKKQRSDDSKQAKSDQRKAAAELAEERLDSDERGAQRSMSEEKKRISAEKQSGHRVHISEERRLERSAEFDQQRLQLQNRFADLPEEKQQALQSKLAAMREHLGSVNEDNFQRPDFRNMTEDQRKEAVANIVESRRDARNAQMADMNPDQKRFFLAELKEKRYNNSQNSVSPISQLGLGIEPNEIICAEGKELVIRVSSGSPICMGYNSAVILVERGLVTYPE